MVILSNELDTSSKGLTLLRQHWIDGSPLVAIWGQNVGWSPSSPDPVLDRAFEHAMRQGKQWSSLLTREPLQDEFYLWLADRFIYRAASPLLIEAARAPWCAVFTSSIDNGLANCIAGNGRAPEVILQGDPAPRFLRNNRRPPFYYLFGQAGQHVAALAPPSTRQGLSIHSMRHASPMLRRLQDTVTPLGLIVIDGYAPNSDWLNADQLLAAISDSPVEGVLWCGDEPTFLEDSQFIYDDLVNKGVIVRTPETLGKIVNELIQSLHVPEALSWDDPEVVSLKGGGIVKTTPNLRLITQASATLIDDSWVGTLDPHSQIETDAAFQAFHATSSSFRSITDGVRRDYAIKRSFEKSLHKRVVEALEQHHNASAIILHGQSGVGKTIAFARLAVQAKTQGYAVLFINRRLPQASDLSSFLAAVDQQQGVTLLLVDTMSAVSRYDDLLRALRSVGHRVVIVGTSYRLDLNEKATNRFIEARALLDNDEQSHLLNLAARFAPTMVNTIKKEKSSQYVLASFYRLLPHSRATLSAGLRREVDRSSLALRNRAASAKPAQLGAFAQAFRKAGYPIGKSELLPNAGGELDNSSEAKAIDLVMISSRLFKAVPLSIILRAVSTNTNTNSLFDIDAMLSLIRGQDLFRWIYSDEEQTDILVEARLQIEARLICEARFGSALREAEAIACLIAAAVRAGPESNGETSYLVELIHAAGPDGPEGDRYSESYALIARALSNLREITGMPNSRLMLQESVLRRHYLRTQKTIEHSEKIKLLNEAVTVVDEALHRIEENGSNGIFASRQTKDNLWNERAATYGFVATDMVQHGQSDEAYSAYKAAHDAAMLAKARRDSSFSTDVSLWMPTGILRQGSKLSEIQRIEISADLKSTIDSVDESMLDEAQKEKFQTRRLDAGIAMKSTVISDDAFARLDQSGSAAGYFIRARNLAPDMKAQNEPSAEDMASAQCCVSYLREHYDKISQDERCLKLLLDMEWVTRTKKWMMRGLRQPFPNSVEIRKVVHTIVSGIAALGEDKLATKYRYLRALTTWLEGNQGASTEMWNELSFDTQFADSQRVFIRHLLTDAQGTPIIYRGVVERQIGPGRYSVRVDELKMTIDCIADYFPNVDLAVGRVITNFAIAFNYRGPLADPLGGVRRSAR
ncbi:ATP-binding protein [Pantoea agglomerans]|uniref:ATP-binding protein n=1 Tax=Enterobacter agglomerans TaxID=549 RepID=UPI001785A7C1|nr:ATP-binding protein [Pantoea agglomerans]MBD8160274.1 ATP-binding protein [Pantoea agglomerans]MBD8233329.1 ATP-binding protein [Pantoea agglomerans]